ncbi:MAG: DNA-processing protein DprA [Spirochaetaceae bacterium]|jgi:DNA processing protein|nr:DNA-processing protein DprA [Spirochaetaceae bacterium]
MDGIEEPLFVCLVLSLTQGINRKDRLRLAETVATEADLDRLSKGAIEERVGRSLRKMPDIAKAKESAEKVAKIAARKGIKMVCCLSGDYPPLLRESYEPPVLLYYRGALGSPEKPLVAMVGTRHPSSDGQAWAYRCGRELGEADLSVVSGLALGIDAMCHRGNVDGGGKTLAVLGSAVDEVYPATNRPLVKRILDSGGALVSEYRPGTRPARWTFPERNRIIAGIARGCVVVEAPKKSGALITARFTLDNNRDLWIGGIGVAPRRDRRLEKFGEGTRNLADQGAKVISGASDILEEWGMRVIRKKEYAAFSGGGLAEKLRKELGLE